MERVVENRKTARRIEMDSVTVDVKPSAFAQFITDKLQEFFPIRDYNRAIKLLTEYFGDKFDILPESIKALFLYVISAADGTAYKASAVNKGVKMIYGCHNIDIGDIQACIRLIYQVY